jgi:hypothetical protein
MVSNPVWEICEHVAEVEALLDGHRAGRQAFGRGRTPPRPGTPGWR